MKKILLALLAIVTFQTLVGARAFGEPLMKEDMMPHPPKDEIPTNKQQ